MINIPRLLCLDIAPVWAPVPGGAPVCSGGGAYFPVLGEIKLKAMNSEKSRIIPKSHHGPGQTEAIYYPDEHGALRGRRHGAFMAGQQNPNKS